MAAIAASISAGDLSTILGSSLPLIHAIRVEKCVKTSDYLYKNQQDVYNIVGIPCLACV